MCERDWYEFDFVNRPPLVVKALVVKATVAADDILVGKSLDDMIREQTGCLRVPREFFFVSKYPFKEVSVEVQEDST